MALTKLQSQSIDTNITVAGIVTATAFYGDGSNLSGVTSATTASYADNAGVSTVAQGLTGTPNITVNDIVAAGASFTGNVSIAGTLTYEDVTNVDAIGIITARSGIKIGDVSIASTLSSDGSAIFSGIVTAVTFVGDLSGNASTATYATSSGIATYADTAGVSTNVSGGTASVTSLNVSGISTLGNVQIGIGSTTLIVDGDARITGILTVGTASVTIDGTNTQINVGSATTISTSGFKIGNSDLHSSGLSITNINATGVVTASTFSGSGASITNLDASNLSSGVVPAARITSTSALNVGGDLYVSGNISFGGTTTQLNTTQVTFSDPDIVLGVGTTSTFNPTDNTANHGGIAIASTEGYPLVNLNINPSETLPTTYKKIMWFKNNAAGLGTDAWLSNFAVGIGSTQFPTGTRLAAGNIQFGVNDINVVRNINSSGVVTATSFVGDGSGLTGAGSTVADDTTTNQTFYPVLTQTTTGTITASKVSTTKLSFNPSTGILSATTFSGSGASLTGVPVSTGISGLGANVATFLATPSSANLASAVTDETGSGALVFATSPVLTTPNVGVATGTSLNVSGSVTAASLVKSGGTSSQFLKADGSVDSSTYITSASVGNGTLTLAVSGTGLSGSASFTANQSGNTTFTVTSNATSANTVSAIVARDASGNFSAGTVTAALSGNASTATNLSTNRTNWSTNGTITAVVGQLSWKNYGNSHTIFDASASTSPDGGAVNNTNSQVAWTGSYPTLMGWNGANTYGVRVDSARVADGVSGTTSNGYGTRTVQAGGSASGGADGDIYYIY